MTEVNWRNLSAHQRKMDYTTRQRSSGLCGYFQFISAVGAVRSIRRRSEQPFRNSHSRCFACSCRRRERS